MSKAIFKEIDDLIIDSSGNCSLPFVGGVVAIQTALNLTNFDP
jgi:hypothetical protein